MSVGIFLGLILPCLSAFKLNIIVVCAFFAALRCVNMCFYAAVFFVFVLLEYVTWGNFGETFQLNRNCVSLCK